MRKVLLVKNIPREGPGLVEMALAKKKILSDTIEMREGIVLPKPSDYSAIFVFGGPGSANDRNKKMEAELSFVRSAVSQGIPYFGVCLGMQVLCKAMGGGVRRNEIPEIGFRSPEGEQFSIELNATGKADPIFAGLPEKIGIFHLHGETGEPGEGIALLATGKFCRSQAVKFGKRAYGFQGHIELTEEMFGDWLNEDEDLRSLSRAQLEKDFKTFGAGLKESGSRIVENFLSIAGL